MRALMLLLALLATGASHVTAQAFGAYVYDLDTIPASRIVEEWRTYEGGGDPEVRYILRHILADRQDPRSGELFDALVPLLRGELSLATRTSSLLGQVDARVPGRWTGVLLQKARSLLEERRDAQGSNLIEYGSPAMKAQGLPLLLARLRRMSEERPPPEYGAQILVGPVLSVPGGREALQ